MDKLAGLGQKIKQYRKMHDMTQEDLAVALGVEPDHIASIERNRRGVSLQRLLQICEYFHISITDFIPDKQQDDTELKNKWKNEIIQAIENLDTYQLRIVKTMIKSLSTEEKNKNK